ncbi:MAG: hypothetical protein OXN89_13535 [Bryobacterales bacterium]|nr:hypothetical protein [Bryobacterales bacterium]
MRRTKLPPAVQRMSATAAAMTSFADAASLLEGLAGVRLIPKQVERTAEAIGHKLARAELADVPGEGQERPPAAPTMYVGVDGTGIPVRKSEVAGRKGKQTNGAARTREAKLVVVFTAEARDEESRPQRDQGSVTYSGAIESAASDPFAPEPLAFSQRVWREASRRGVFGDGAAWIWKLAHEQFPGAIEIVDLFHAKQEIWNVAKACFAGDRQRIRHWAEAR